MVNAYALASVSLLCAGMAHAQAVAQVNYTTSSNQFVDIPGGAVTASLGTGEGIAFFVSAKIGVGELEIIDEASGMPVAVTSGPVLPALEEQFFYFGASTTNGTGQLSLRARMRATSTAPATVLVTLVALPVARLVAAPARSGVAVAQGNFAAVQSLDNLTQGRWLVLGAANAPAQIEARLKRSDASFAPTAVGGAHLRHALSANRSLLFAAVEQISDAGSVSLEATSDAGASIDDAQLFAIELHDTLQYLVPGVSSSTTIERSLATAQAGPVEPGATYLALYLANIHSSGDPYLLRLTGDTVRLLTTQVSFAPGDHLPIGAAALVQPTSTVFPMEVVGRALDGGTLETWDSFFALIGPLDGGVYGAPHGVSPPLDAGATSDAGTSPTGGQALVAPSFDVSCGCNHAPSALALLFALTGNECVRRRRRSRRATRPSLPAGRPDC